MKLLKQLINVILDILLPHSPREALLISMTRCGTLRSLPPSPPAPRTSMKALFHYKDPRVRTLVWQIKYAGNSELTDAVANLLSEEIISFFEERGSFTDSNWLLVPIPASKRHLKEKGFNQTLRLCEVIMKTSASNFIVFEPSALIKVRETVPQVDIKNKNKRSENLKNAYGTLNAELLKGRNIFVIDDVITTGSTFLEARRALKAAGARSVICLAIAH